MHHRSTAAHSWCLCFSYFINKFCKQLLWGWGAFFLGKTCKRNELEPSPQQLLWRLQLILIIFFLYSLLWFLLLLIQSKHLLGGCEVDRSCCTYPFAIKRQQVDYMGAKHSLPFPSVVKAALHGCVLNCVWLLATPWTVALRVPLSMEFSRQEYWNECHFLLQGIFLTQGSNPHLLHLLHWWVNSLPLSHLGSPKAALSLPNSQGQLFMPEWWLLSLSAIL